VGIVGPTESISKILIVSKEFQNIKCIPFPYKVFEEIPAIIQQNNTFIDQWFFSGIMNYTFILDKKLLEERKMNFPLLHGSSFFGSLLEIQQKENRLIKSLSIDTITKNEIEKVSSFYNLNSLTCHSIPFTNLESINEIIEFHKESYESNLSEIAITANKKVFTSLKAAEVPAYRLTPSYSSIKLTFELLIEKAQTSHFENLQLAVLGCKILNFEETSESSYFNFKLKELYLEKSLLEITQQLNGSFIRPADGLYYIYTTRGEIDEEIEDILFESITLQNLQNQLNICFCIGYGNTVFHAEKNVRFGLGQMNFDSNTPVLLIVSNEKNIIQKTPKKLVSPLNSSEIKKKLAEYDVNDRDVLRIALFVHKYKKVNFTVEDVAEWLHGTKRNARRILSDLVKEEVLEVYDKIRTSSRGRPSYLYRFKNINLIKTDEIQDYIRH
jgi:predicted transcriptional regulator